jgi:hypothetical protein
MQLDIRLVGTTMLGNFVDDADSMVGFAESVQVRWTALCPRLSCEEPRLDIR